MALEATFRELSVNLHHLYDALDALHMTVGDKPEHDGAAVADDLADRSMEMMGTLHEARKAAINARRAVGHPIDLDRARRALAVCQERFQRIERQFSGGLAAYEKLQELGRIGGERRGEWQAWSASTRQGIEECRGPLEQTSNALAACWQDLAERLGTVNFSVQTVGQQIGVPGSEIAELAHEKT